jgi:hypothetical protein
VTVAVPTVVANVVVPTADYVEGLDNALRTQAGRARPDQAAGITR